MRDYEPPLRLYERVASALIGTPLQRPAEWLRRLTEGPRRRRHPELREIYIEGERIQRVIERAVTSSTNCVDVGAHLGSILSEFVRLSPSGRHIAIEPIPAKARRLKRKFPHVEVHQVALGAETRDVEFHYNPRRSGFSGLARPLGQAESRRITVKCRRLDDIVPPNMPIGFIKVDVEGAELHVLNGSRRVIAESQPIIVFECTASGLSAFGLKPAQILSFFSDIHYGVFLLKDWLSGGALVDLPKLESSMVYPFQAFNFVAAPASGPG